MWPVIAAAAAIAAGAYAIISDFMPKKALKPASTVAFVLSLRVARSVAASGNTLRNSVWL